MGLVLVAYDPELDRKVAIKLLKFSGEMARSRLQREAQALAKLAHRNVVAVYDVGTHAGQLFMAMEFVRGTTLGSWMSALDAPRPWAEVVEVFSEAGRGLAAAHQAGLVHRDFKPENVMMGDDGRVRVMDFGLARTTSLEDDLFESDVTAALSMAASATASVSMSEHALTQSLTRTGALLGTPAYMSPEQLEGKPATERSDQFGFCVALYEALYGKRPFPSGSLIELVESVTSGQVQDPPRTSTVPLWLRRVVLRGLAPAPDERWPSMQALLDALADDPEARRRKWMLGVLAAVVLGGAVWGAAAMLGHDEQTCVGLGHKLVGVWDQSRREAVEASILATELSYAPGTWDRVEQGLDDYTTAWVTARTEACEATQRGEQSGQLLDRRMACLDHHLTHVRATVERLTRADQTAVESAVEAVEKLPRIDACAYTEALLAGGSSFVDPLRAREAAALEDRVIEAHALQNLGQIDEALELVESTVSEAEALDVTPVRVRVSLALGQLQHVSGDYEAAEATLTQTYREAIIADMPKEAGTAARQLVGVLGSGGGLARPKDGRSWAIHAEAFTKAAGSDVDYGQYLIDLGELAKMDGEYGEAREHFERALEIFEGLGVDYGVVMATSHLANVASYEGEFEDARHYYERALKLLLQTRDPTHPDIGRLYLSLGENARLEQLHFDEARKYLELAVTVFEQALGPEHPLLGYTLGSLGSVAGWQRDFEAGRAYLERAIRVIEASVGTGHFYYADANSKMGVLAFLARDYPSAREHYERARLSYERTMGPDHPNVGYELGNLGELALVEGQHERAREHAEAALAILESKLGAQHPGLVVTLETLGGALLGLGRPGEALDPLERALAIQTDSQAGAPELAKARFALAQALWDAPEDGGRDRERARELAELARAAWAAADDDEAAAALARVDAWLASLDAQ